MLVPAAWRQASVSAWLLKSLLKAVAAARASVVCTWAVAMFSGSGCVVLRPLRSSSARGWLLRLRGRAELLRQHAIGELGGLGFYPPGPPSEPAGPTLNALAAAVGCARRNVGHRPQMTWALIGRLGLARFLMAAPAG